ncbi:MAG TPA: ABC transporter permease [Clostridiales bacterium]|nr:ABC transporter permease [Clostridiales bacterium]
MKKYRSVIIQWMGLILVILIFGIWSGGNLFSKYNLNSMIITATPLLIACLGMSFIFAHGGMDISSGAVVALASLAAVVTMNGSGSLLLAVIVSMLASMACYMVNSVITNKFGLMATITSLSIMFAARGLVTYICQQTPNESISIASVDVTLFKKNYSFMVLVAVIAILVLTVVFNYTEIGKGAKAIGDNSRSAGQNGVPVDRTKMTCYAIAGLCVGIAAIFKLCSTGMVQSTTGTGMEMDILVVVVLGGMSLSGGVSTKISSAVVGTFTYVFLVKGMTIIGLNPNIVVLIKALIFLMVIYITAQRNTLKTIPR